MKFKYITILAILLILAGCSGGSSVGSDWKTGTDGVVLSFVDSGISEYHADEEYSMVLEVRNRGTYPENDDDSLPVDIYFTGFDRDLLPDLDYAAVDVIGGKTPTNPEGGLEYYDIDFYVRMYADDDEIEQDIKATACYPYSTKAPIDVCVDPNPVENEEDSCTPGVLEYSSGQGAPIAITSVTAQSLKGKVRYAIEFQNVGTGTVYDGGTDRSTCLNPELSAKDIVWVDGVYLGDYTMDCTPSDRVRLVNGVGRMSCSLDGLDIDEPSYITSLGVQLSYTYKNSIVKKVYLKNIN